MSKLDALIAERALIREKAIDLTQEIKLERKLEAEARAAHIKPGEAKYEHYAALLTENRRLRGLFATLEKSDNNRTYKELGYLIGVSPERARQIVKKQVREMRVINRQIEKDDAI